MAIRTAYGWKDLDVNILGDILTEIKEIKYKKKVDKQNNYGRGAKPTSRSRGNETYEVSMSMSMAEIVALRKAVQAAGGSDETSIAPFDIPCTYVNESNEIVTDVIRNFEFTEANGGGAQNDMELVAECPGICSGIDFARTV